jgi:hypothetical protein
MYKVHINIVYSIIKRSNKACDIINKNNIKSQEKSNEKLIIQLLLST